MTSACRTATPGPGEARARLSADDRLEAAPPARAFAPVSDGDILTRNTRIRAVAGEPELDLRGGGRVALLPNASVTASQPLFIEKGEVLVSSTRAVDVATAMTEVRVRGITRVAQGLASAVRVYRGTATVSSSGRSLVVESLRQTAIPAPGFVGKRATPTTWRADDVWDTRYLRTVIALTDALEAQGRGFATHAHAASAADIAALLPAVDAVALARAAARHSAGDALVAGAIASAGSSPIAGVFGLRDAGAAWGIVAVEQARGDEYRAVELVRAAIAAWLRRHGTAGRPVLGTGGATPGTPAPGGGGPTTGGSTTVTTVAPGGGGGTTSPPTTSPPIVTVPTVPAVTVPTLPPPTVPEVTIPPVTTTVLSSAEEVIDGVVGGLVDN